MQDKRYPQEHHHTWGIEKFLFLSPECTVKELKFYFKHKTTLHYHQRRTEILYCQSGRFMVRLFDPETSCMAECELRPGASIQVPRGIPHQICCEETGILIETSLNYVNEDTQRIYDEELLIRGPSLR